MWKQAESFDALSAFMADVLPCLLYFIAATFEEFLIEGYTSLGYMVENTKDLAPFHFIFFTALYIEFEPKELEVRKFVVRKKCTLFSISPARYPTPTYVFAFFF